jgi:hypothetical protein
MKSETMRRIALAVGVLMACTIFAANKATAQPVSQHVTVTGWISCTHCLMPNTCKAQTRPSCIQQWVSQGDPYIFVVGNHRYKMLGDDKELAKAAAQNSVTVTGDLDGNVLTVTSVDWKGKQSGRG